MFNELGYVLPDKSPHTYADRAMAVVKDLLESDPSTAIYAMQPSAILALSGLRAISPYHRFSTETTRKQRHAFDSVLGKHGLYCIGDKQATDFSFISQYGTQDVPNRYAFFADSWTAPNAYDANTIMEWMDINGGAIDADMRSGKLPAEWLKNKEWAVQNIRFGMMLGYPGVAISSALWAGAEGDPSGVKTLKPMIISDGSPYFGTEVSYDVHPSVIDSQQINQHQELLSKTLQIVNEALPYDELMSNQQFADAYQRMALDE